ncbi:MAG: hypothetical protein AAF517_08210 [Planctomycetota bacterium]
MEKSRRRILTLVGIGALTTISFATSLRAGGPSLSFSQTGGDGSDGEERIHFVSSTTGITIEHRGARRPCCLDFVPLLSVEEGTIRILETDASKECGCEGDDDVWTLRMEITGLPFRSYDVFLLRETEGGENLLTSAELNVARTETLEFIRGEVNDDGAVDLSDAVNILDFLFQGGRAPRCRDRSDVNDDGETDLSDSIYLLSFLFLGGPPPRAPFPEAGEDPTQDDRAQCRLTNEVVTVTRFVRTGDFDGDGQLTLTDGVSLLNYLFLGGPEPYCADAIDANDDGVLSTADICSVCPICCPSPFAGGAGAPAGNGDCSQDDTPDRLGCRVNNCDL